MKKVILLLALFAIGTIAFSQEVTVRFTGQLNGTDYCRLDSVAVTNLTRNWTETIEYPDTIIVLGSMVDANLNIATVQGLGQNIPNPFNCETRVELSLSQREDVRMQLLDVTGKIYAEYNGSLDAGVHTFDISAANPQTYLLNAAVGNCQYSIRMVNVGSGCGCSIKYAGIYGGIEAKLTSANEFQIGDNMRYVGYTTIEGETVASEAEEQIQAVNQYITLNFIHYFRPSVETLAATDITISSATLRGNITYNGGAPINSCGFYYGTSEDNLSQNVSATATGNEFSFTIRNLSLGTNYYYKAYVTNSAGMAMGDIVMFTTCNCGGSITVTDIDGNQYSTVAIGEQCWMAENLRTTKFADGTSIPLGSSTSTTTAYRYNPNNNSNNVPTYGYLYNWPAAMHGASSSSSNPSNVQGVCQNGWHLPSDAEWTRLTDYLCSHSQYQCGSDSSYIAKSLASTTGWNSSTTTCAVGNTPSNNNSTGFCALPAGVYGGSGYSSFGNDAYFWSATEGSSDHAYRRNLNYNSADVHRSNSGETFGMSIRCVRD